MSHIFISHVEEDADVALGIALGLEQEGFPTWCYELDSIPGPSYLVVTGQAIESSSAVVLVVSADSLGSSQMTKEVVRAHESGKPFIPVLRDITHVEFQARQPEWREAIGAATSIRIPAEGPVSIVPRVAQGLKVMGIHPGKKSDPARIQEIGRKLDELDLSKREEPPKGVSQPGPREATLAGKAYETLKRWGGRPAVRLAAVFAAVMGAVVGVAIFVLVGLLSGGGEGDSGPAALMPSPSGGTPTVAPGTPTVAPGTPTVAPGTPTVAPGTPTVTTGTPTVAPSTPTVAPSTPTVAPRTPTVAPSTRTVAPSTPTGGPAPPIGEADEFAISASPECVAPGGRVEATWTAVDQQTGDIMALFPAAARNDRYHEYEWAWVSTAGGRLIFPASSTPGEYEVRLLRSDTHLAASNPISVQDDCPARAATAELEGYSATASLECVAPGGRLEVIWTAVDQETGDIVALFPAAARNDRYHEYEWDWVSTAGGRLVFPAPSNPGEYEFRLVREGNHLAVSQPITVSNDC